MANDMTVVMRFQAEASALKAELAVVKTGLKDVVTAVQAAADPAAVLDAKLTAVGTAGRTAGDAAAQGMAEVAQGAAPTAITMRDLVQQIEDIALVSATAGSAGARSGASVEQGMQTAGRGAREASGAVTALSGAIDQLQATATGTARTLVIPPTTSETVAEAARAYQSLMAAIDPLLRAQQQFEAQQQLVNRALELGAVTQDDAARSLQILSARYDELRRAATSGTGAKSAVDSASVFLETERAQAAYQGLQAAINPAIRAQQEFEAAQQTVNRALAAGVITQDQASQSLMTLSARYAALGQASRHMDVATHSIANLSYQFNDIGMMWAAGQNPLMTAIQQGTQVGQVLGPMGAAGAVKALGAAFVALLNPVTLAVMAIIAGGGAIVQWMSSSEEEVRSLDDAVGDLRDAVSTYASESGKDLGELKRDFGEVTPEVQRLHSAMVDLAEAKALVGITAAVRGLKSELSGGWLTNELGVVADMLNVDPMVRLSGAEMRDIDMGPVVGQIPTVMTKVNPQITEFQAALDGLQDVKGVTAQIAAMDDLRRRFEAATGGIDKMTAAQLEYYSGILATKQQLEVFVALQQRAGRDAAADLDTLRRQADLNKLILQYGEDSAVVVAARLKAERDIFVAQTQTRDVSDEVKRQLIEAWDAANDLAGVDLRANIAEALGPASRLGELLRQAAGWWQQARSGMAAAQNEAGAVVGSGAAGVPQVPSGLGTYSLTPGFNPLAPDQAPRTSPTPAARPDDIDFGLPPIPKGAGGGGRGDSDAVKSLSELRLEVQELLSDLDLQAAQIAEKVRLGLMSTSEGAEALAQARRETAEGIADLIPQMEAQNKTAGPEAAAAVETARMAVQGLAGDWDRTGRALADVGKDMSTSFADAFGGFLAGASSAEDAMASLENAVTSAIARMFSQKLEERVFTPIFGPMFESIFSFLPFAKGGVPDAPGLEAHANTIVDRPTPFRMADGRMAVAGEQDPEAILPLKDGGVRAVTAEGSEITLPLTRASSGHLGVALPAADITPATAAEPQTDAAPAVQPGLDRPETRLAQFAREARAVLGAAGEDPIAAPRPGLPAPQMGSDAAAQAEAAPAGQPGRGRPETRLAQFVREARAVLGSAGEDLIAAPRPGLPAPQMGSDAAPQAEGAPVGQPGKGRPETRLAQFVRETRAVLGAAGEDPVAAGARDMPTAQMGTAAAPQADVAPAGQPGLDQPETRLAQFAREARAVLGAAGEDPIAAPRPGLPAPQMGAAAAPQAEAAPVGQPGRDRPETPLARFVREVAELRAVLSPPPALAALGDSVVDRPTRFAMAEGREGEAGEAGAEAILPLVAGKVRAVTPGGETTLPLTRTGSGHLAVLPPMPDILNRPPFAFAQGGIVSQGRALEIGRETGMGHLVASPAAGGTAPRVEVNVINNAGQVVEAQKTERSGMGGERIIDVMIEQIEGAMSERAAGGRSSFAGTMAQIYGLNRQGR